MFTRSNVGRVLSNITCEEFVVEVTGSLNRPTESVTIISKMTSPSGSESIISYIAKYFWPPPNSEIFAAWPTIDVTWSDNNSFATNFIEIVSPTLAQVESALLDLILTGSSVGLVLSKTTVDTSVVVSVPAVGFPAISLISPI